MGDVINGPESWNRPSADVLLFEPEPVLPRKHFGLRRAYDTKREALSGCLETIRDIVRESEADRAEQDRIKNAARAARDAFDRPSPGVCRSLLDATATELSLAAEVCATRADMLRRWGHTPLCVATLEISSKLETLAAQILAINHTEQTP